ncbi:MAG: hypothetical protein IT374_27665 [Polyangiaceae bacterium]|nr:hypothetical protein [Polyangiaceae bacterium]
MSLVVDGTSVATRTINFDELDPIPAIAFALVAAVDVERDEMRNRLSPLEGDASVLKVAAPEGTYYVGKCGGYPCVLVTCQAGSGGRDGSTLAIVDAIDRWRPYAVLLLGIAFGRDPKKQVVGDVLVSTQVVPYELQRAGAVTIHRGPRPEADGTLLDRVRHLDCSWTPEGQSEARKPRRGPILSGEKLVDDEGVKAAVFAACPEAEGGEMEGAGLYAAAARRRLPWLIVKAICDWGVKKHKRAQSLAARNACAVVGALLAEPSLRAQDLGAKESPAESRAERLFREQARRGRRQELLSRVRDAQRRQQERADDLARFLRENLAELQRPPQPQLETQLATLDAARTVAMEVLLNTYNDACVAYLHGEVEREPFLKEVGTEVRELGEATEEKVRERLHPRETSAYSAIWAVYDEVTAPPDGA